MLQKCPSKERGDVRLDGRRDVRAATRSIFVKRHDAVANAQQREDVEMLAGLGHHAVVGGHDEDDGVHAAGPGDHGLDEVLVAGHVDDADLRVGDLAGGEAEFDRHAPLFLLLEPVGFAAGQALDQRGLAVVDMAGRAEGDVDLFQNRLLHLESDSFLIQLLLRQGKVHRGEHG